MLNSFRPGCRQRYNLFCLPNIVGLGSKLARCMLERVAVCLCCTHTEDHVPYHATGGEVGLGIFKPYPSLVPAYCSYDPAPKGFIYARFPLPHGNS